MQNSNFFDMSKWGGGANTKQDAEKEQSSTASTKKSSIVDIFSNTTHHSETKKNLRIRLENLTNLPCTLQIHGVLIDEKTNKQEPLIDFPNSVKTVKSMQPSHTEYWRSHKMGYKIRIQSVSCTSQLDETCRISFHCCKMIEWNFFQLGQSASSSIPNELQIKIEWQGTKKSGIAKPTVTFALQSDVL